MDLLRDLDRRIAYGVVGGTFAGLLFLLANMWYADNQGLPAVAPLYDISTIFYFTDKPDPQPINAAVGLVVHLTLSAAFGAALAALAPLARGAGRLMGMGAAFGLVLYLVNFQILGRVAFEWFQEGRRRSRSSRISATAFSSPRSSSASPRRLPSSTPLATQARHGLRRPKP